MPESPFASLPAGNASAPARLHLWRGVTAGLWVASVVGLLLYIAGDYRSIGLLLDVLFHSQNYNISAGQFVTGFFSNEYDDLNSSLFFRLWLSGWGLAALVKLAKLGPDPAGWTAFRPFTWLVVCVVAVAGFPLMALINAGLDALPAGWVLGIARLLLTPLLLPFMGLLTRLAGRAATERRGDRREVVRPRPEGVRCAVGFALSRSLAVSGSRESTGSSPLPFAHHSSEGTASAAGKKFGKCFCRGTAA